MRKKVYGQSRIDKCPFCGKQATAKNSQGVTVCIDHKDTLMPDFRCSCGDYLDIKEGKYGYFFLCMNCGPQSPSKVFELNDPTVGSSSKTKHGQIKVKFQDSNDSKQPIILSSIKKNQKETVVRSDDPRYF